MGEYGELCYSSFAHSKSREYAHMVELLLNRQRGSKDGVIHYINNLCFGSVTTSPFLEFGGPQNSIIHAHAGMKKKW